MPNPSKVLGISRTLPSGSFCPGGWGWGGRRVYAEIDGQVHNKTWDAHREHGEDRKVPGMGFEEPQWTVCILGGLARVVCFPEEGVAELQGEVLSHRGKGLGQKRRKRHGYLRRLCPLTTFATGHLPHH